MKTIIIIIFIIYFLIRLGSGIYVYFFAGIINKAKINILTTIINKKNYLIGIVENAILIILLSLLFIL